MSLRNEIHRNNQINVKQLIILFNTIIRVIFPASTLSSERRTTATFDETRGYLHAFGSFVAYHGPLKLVIQLFLFYSSLDAGKKNFSS